MEFPLTAKCQITLNNQKTKDGEPFTLADLLPGDQITIDVDSQAHRIEAHREVRSAGVITGLDRQARTIGVQPNGPGNVREYTLVPNCKIELREPPEPVEWEFVRVGDKVELEYQALDENRYQASQLSITPSPDPRTWVVLIAQEKYKDTAVPPIGYAAADVARVRAALLGRYRVPSGQILLEEDAPHSRALEQNFAAFLPRIPEDAQFLCYYIGQGFIDGNGTPPRSSGAGFRCWPDPKKQASSYVG